MAIDPFLIFWQGLLPILQGLKKHYLLYGIRKNIEIYSDFPSEIS